MAMNTTYLGSSATVPENLNTSYISTGLTEISSAVSFWGPVTYLQGVTGLTAANLSASTATFTTLVVTGVSTLSGLATATSGISLGAGSVFDGGSGHTHAGFVSALTTASGTSVLIPDGGFMFTNVSVTSCTLQFRSGVTTYTIRADAGAVL